MATLQQTHDKAVGEVANWVQATFANPTAVPANELRDSKYRPSAGWLLPLVDGGALLLLLTHNFPYAEPLLFLHNRPDLMKGPHVEIGGKVCVTGNSGRVDATRPAEIVRYFYEEAVALIRSNLSGENDADFLDDFGAYWLRAASGITKTIIEPRPPTRTIVARRGNNTTLVAESQELARRFFANIGGYIDCNVEPAIAIWLNRLLVPTQYPSTVQELRVLVANTSAEDLKLLDAALADADSSLLVVLMGPSPRTQRNLLAPMLIEAREAANHPGNKVRDPLNKGFRPGRAPAIVLAARFQLTRHAAERVDGAATRRLPSLTSDLSSKSACLIGCGSLGSGIAKLLMQSGVGTITIIDPDTLSWDNIERHELGGDSVGCSKALEMASQLRKKYPLAVSVTGYAEDWRDVMRHTPRIISDADLIVSTCADWNAESALNDTHREGLIRGPIVYGWLEEFALATHAMAITSHGPCLKCGFSATGECLVPAIRAPQNAQAGCGGGVSLYGALDLAPAQALIASTSLDLLMTKAAAPVYRVLVSPRSNLCAAGADWDPRWLSRYGPPPVGGTVVAGSWPTREGCPCHT